MDDYVAPLLLSIPLTSPTGDLDRGIKKVATRFKRIATLLL